jgi:hypothetical protein
MRYEKPRYEFPIDWQDWCTGAGQPAGIWWLDGRTHFAGFGSMAEARLAAAGAFHVATLQFEGDVIDSRQRGRTIDSVELLSMLRLLELPASARAIADADAAASAARGGSNRGKPRRTGR